MSLKSLTMTQLETRLDWLENMLRQQRHPITLQCLTQMYQEIVNELAERDMHNEREPV
jgi:hypothetical protein